MKTTASLTVFQQLMAISHETGLPRTFKTDLEVHDRLFIENHPNAVFVWIVYNEGTQIIRVNQRIGETERFWALPARDVVRMVHSAFEESGAKLFWVDCRFNSVVPCHDLDHCDELIHDFSGSGQHGKVVGQ